MPFINYFITVLFTSVVWFCIVQSLDIRSHNKNVILQGQLIDLRIKYERLLFDFETLRLLIPKPLTPLEKAFNTLELTDRASQQEVKNKYRLLIKKYHPDLNKSKEAGLKFQQIHAAYNLINQHL